MSIDVSNEFEVYGGDPIKQNVTVKTIHLPFLIYTKTITEDPQTGKKKVTSELKTKTQDEIVKDSIILGVTATSINAIGNGIAHLIYACKKKPHNKK